MAKLLTGVSVFAALLCGEPDLLAVVCLYLAAAIALSAGVAALLRCA